MMEINNIAYAFVQFGKKCKELSEKSQDPIFTKAAIENPWFTSDEIRRALQALSIMLSEEQVSRFIAAYPSQMASKAKRVGLIAAGNIPMVCFHDIFCILMSGHHVHIKLSAQDTVLTEFMIRFLCKVVPALAEKIEIPDTLKHIEALIATGSDNTAMHLDYYFRAIPRIVRKNRTSIAVIEGTETEQDYKNLATDVFAYYGLGCRSVSKLFVPQNWTIDLFYERIYNYHYVIDHPKYHNNYLYHKAIFLMNKTEFYENHFLMLMPNTALFAPTSVLYYETYIDGNDLKNKLQSIQDKIQCIVGHRYIPFGQAQLPSLFDFADGVDTMLFLRKI